MLARSNRIQTGVPCAGIDFSEFFPIPNPAKPEPKIFVRYSPVIPLISGNPVTNISLIFLENFARAIPGSAKQRIEKNVIYSILHFHHLIDNGGHQTR
uniref:Uncharacterized protein n=1 Tax=Candidatus Kentrum sp. LPFa TaxID=2126335 RepID=A0A450XKC4_9GAMM|nr:MAG: hypothetical protein BECKLPF1236A_GA0070988_100953 [Candidatus Kentron sp. LPFa]VFK29751.1 MAG: hypothetical protein BECKLPF1236C_GA0070990_100943 [Candidatus Kentron sp. LPFa]